MAKIFEWLFPDTKCSLELSEAVHRHSIAKNCCRATLAMTQDSAIDNIHVKREETKHLKRLAKDSGERQAVKENGTQPHGG